MQLTKLKHASLEKLSRGEIAKSAFPKMKFRRKYPLFVNTEKTGHHYPKQNFP